MKNEAPSVRAHRIVVETKWFVHPFRANANPYKISGKKKTKDDKGGMGTQIVNEVLVCGECHSL